MAKIKHNVILDGISGKVGDSLVFRQVAGKTILAKAPDMSRRKVSPAQKAHLNKFELAKEYARKLKDRPELKAAYQTRASGNKAAYHVAIGDFMNSPKIERIDVHSYHGRAGDTIRIRATDDFQVTRVQLTVLAPDGTLVEEGDAVLQANGVDWIYAATIRFAPIKGCRIKASAMDRPGNVGEMEFEVD